MIRAALESAYARCESRAELLVIVLDALDQAGAPENVQRDVRITLSRWDDVATDAALQAWIDSEEP